MRGTAYAYMEILGWMLIAALLGLAIGWILSRWTLRRKLHSELAAQYEQRFRVTSARLAEYQSRSYEDGVIGSVEALEGAEDQIAALESTVAHLERQLQGKVEEAAQADAQVTALEIRLLNVQEQVSELTFELEPSQAGLVKEEEKGRAVSVGRTSEAARQVSVVETATRFQEDTKVVDLTELEDDRADLPDREVAIAEVERIALRTQGDEPPVDDDLKQIYGIGQKLEELLNGVGITSFRQVARLTAEDVRNVAVAIKAFPGRIERDDWMSSAAQLHLEKYGNPV